MLKNKNIFFPIIIIVLLTFVTYYSSLFYGITNWDDDGYITNDPYIRELSIKNIQHIFSVFYFGNYHPIVLLVYSVLYHFFKISSFAFHFLNIFFHLINSVLVFYLIYKLLNNITIAFITGLLFGIHPMHVESVTWISGTKDVLYTLFYLCSLISYYFYLKKPCIKYYLLVIFLFILSCLSKAMAVTLPIILILTDYFFSRKFCVKTLLEKIPFFFISIIIGIIAIYAQVSVHAVSNYSIWIEKIIIAFYGIMFYIYKMFLPVKLSAIYPFPNSNLEIYTLKFFICPVLVAAIVILLYYYRKSNKLMIFGFLFYIANIILILQIISVGAVIAADRYFYLSSIGLFLIIGYFLNYIYINLKSAKKLLILIIITIISLLSLMTFEKEKDWKDSYTLWNSIINLYPKSNSLSIVYNNLGILKSDLHNYSEAIKDYNEAIRRDPKYSIAYFNRGLAESNLKNYSGAMNDFNIAEKLNPQYFDLYFNRGIMKINIGDYTGAISDYDKSIKNNPGNSKAYYNRGIAKSNKKNYLGAIDDFSIAIALENNNGNAYNNRGYAKNLLKNYSGAIEDFNYAVKFMPDNAYAYNNRGFAEAKLKKFKKAIDDCNKSLSIVSGNAEAHFNLGYIYYLLKDYLNAHYEFNKAIEIKPNYGEAFYYEGNIYLIQKNKTRACKNLQKALDYGFIDADSLIKGNCK